MPSLTPLGHSPLPTVAPIHIDLYDGSTLSISHHVPADAAERRAAVHGSTLYAFVGPRLDLPVDSAGVGLHHDHASSWPAASEVIGGYVGKTEALTGRADISFTQWVIAVKAFDPTAMALLHRPGVPYDPDVLSVIEARVIGRLATDMGSISLTNTHSSADRAAARLSAADLANAVRLGDTIAHHIWEHALGFWTNPWPAPVPNAREAAVRILQRAAIQERRALDLRELTSRLEVNGYQSKGKTRWRSVRRDIADREAWAGAARAHTQTYRGRVLFWATSLSRAEALAGYDAAHPVPRSTRTGPTSSPAVEL